MMLDFILLNLAVMVLLGIIGAKIGSVIYRRCLMRDIRSERFDADWQVVVACAVMSASDSAAMIERIIDFQRYYTTRVHDHPRSLSEVYLRFVEAAHSFTSNDHIVHIGTNGAITRRNYDLPPYLANMLLRISVEWMDINPKCDGDAIAVSLNRVLHKLGFKRVGGGMLM